jgi:hypothetical protein
MLSTRNSTVPAIRDIGVLVSGALAGISPNVVGCDERARTVLGRSRTIRKVKLKRDSRAGWLATAHRETPERVPPYLRNASYLARTLTQQDDG